VAGLAYCAGIACCQLILDVGRAQTWTAALTQWCEAQPDLVPYRGNCLVHRAEILTLHGDWPAAHVEAERARELLADSPSVSGVGDAYYQLGELYRLRGEYADAEIAYKNASKNGRDTQPGLGLLRLAQGHPESAAASIRRALEETPAGIARVRLLRAQVEVALTIGDVDAARAAADGLGALAENLGVPLIRAQALQADGEVALAQGHVQPALIRLREACKIWQELAAPHDAARTRMLIAAACRALGDDDSAELELDAACWTFTELGAAPDLARAQQLSQRTSGAAAGASSLPERGLSLREVQVLRLVAAGKTNRAIATELFLSEKTVHRHLSNIFAKLDVSSRSAATAYAFRHGLV
jgi:ATP/maltotriose-dependent transcriptional regulator MalT